MIGAQERRLPALELAEPALKVRPHDVQRSEPGPNMGNLFSLAIINHC